MKLIEKNKGEVAVISDLDISLANAIRRSVAEIPILAINEIDIYKNDSVLYDEVIAHRLGLIPLKNQKVKNKEIELKLKVKGKQNGIKVMSGELGELVVYDDMPIVLLDEHQELELVAKARMGKGIEHSKFLPGMIYYKYLPKIKITHEGELYSELAETFPENFEFTDGKLKIKNAYYGDLDQDDLKDYPGVSIEFGDELIIYIESWGQIDAKKVFIEACEALQENLDEVLKAIK